MNVLVWPVSRRPPTPECQKVSKKPFCPHQYAINVKLILIGKCVRGFISDMYSKNISATVPDRKEQEGVNRQPIGYRIVTEDANILQLST